MKISNNNCGVSLERLKGVFYTDEGVVRLQWAGGKLSEERCAYRRDGCVDIIATGNVEIYFQRWQSALQQAQLRDDEKKVDSEVLELVLPSGERLRLDRDDLIALPGGIADVSQLLPKRKGAAASFSSLLDSLPQSIEGAEDDHEAVVMAIDGFASPAVPLSALRKALLLHSMEGAALAVERGGTEASAILREAAIVESLLSEAGKNIFGED